MKIKLNNSIFFILILIGFFSNCGNRKESEITDDVTSSAANYLSDRRCQDAIDLLENYGRRNNHAFYLRTLASAYACRAGFSEPSFYSNVSSIGSTAAGLLNALAAIDTSDTTGPTDADFVDLQTAINILIFAGEVSVPTVDERSNVFTSKEASEINVQLLYMIITQLGKYSYLYGNADPVDGSKGASNNGNNNTNQCFLTYTNTNAKDHIDNDSATGVCDDADNEPGHSLLTTPSVSQALYVERACQGVILMNHFLDLLNGVTLGSGLGNLGTLQTDVSTVFTAACALVSGDGAGTICNTYSQSTCETNYSEDVADADNSGANSIEIYMSYYYEVLMQ